MWTISLRRNAVQELYQVERRVRADVSSFISGLSKDPHPKGSQLVDEDDAIYRAFISMYEIYYSLQDNNWLVVLRIKLRDDMA